MVIESQNALNYFLYVVLAMLGGAVRVLSKKDHEGNFVKPKAWNFVGGCITSGFVGIILIYACEYLGLQSSATGMIVGCGAFIGTDLIQVAFEKLQRWVDRKIENS